MDLQVFPRSELSAVLGALRNVATENGRFTDAERALIEGIARIHEQDISADALEPISFEEVARIVVDPHRRKRAVQIAIVTALVEGTPGPETEAAVRRFADALGFDEAGLAVLSEVANGNAMIARFDMIRRVARFIRNADGFPGPLGMAIPMLGLGGDAKLAARYRELESCPKGSLGRSLYDFFVDNGFAFPGEPHGIPMVFHDLGHVLAGYGTNPQEEIQQAAFQAGFARRDGFSFLLFGILQFHIGLRITPVAKGYQGLFDVPRVLKALERGARCSVDLSDGFDLFAHRNTPLEAVRAELGIPPLERPAAHDAA